MTLIAIISLILLVFLRINLVVFKRYCTALRRILLVFFLYLCILWEFHNVSFKFGDVFSFAFFLSGQFADLYMFVTQSNTRI